MNALVISMVLMYIGLFIFNPSIAILFVKRGKRGGMGVRPRGM